MSKFNYNLAFSRTIGFVTQQEQEILKSSVVAVAGLGGVGGDHVLTLARLGIGTIHISDMDTFEIENFNRQAGANTNTIGRPKIEVITEMAKAINPEIIIKCFPTGLTKENIPEFFFGVDVYIDGLDFFAFDIRRRVFKFCYLNNIPAITVGPIGMGAALVSFLPGKMSFEKYFNWKDTDSDLELGLKFIMGLTPNAPHRSYLVHVSSLNFKIKKGPSTPMGCKLSAGVANCEVLKILLKRGKIYSAPHSIVFDGYYNKIFHNYLCWGNRGPLQKLKFFIARRMISKQL